MILNKSYVKNKEFVLIPNLEEGAHWENWKSTSSRPRQVEEWKTALRLRLSNLQSNSSFWSFPQCLMAGELNTQSACPEVIPI